MYEQFVEYFNKNLPTDVPGGRDNIHIPSQKKTYRDYFCNEYYNLSFFHPKKDQCATCAAHGHVTADNDDENARLFEEHVKQNEKRNDKDASCADNTYIMAPFDMQSILKLPTSELGPVYYKRKLVLHNLTSMRGKNQTEVFAVCGRKLMAREELTKLAPVF